MTFVPFAMERYQSTWEHEVDLNLSESGVHPLSLAELLDLTGIDLAQLGRQRLCYVQSNGSEELRLHIAAFHPGATADGIVVTNGSAEANFVSTWELCSGGGEIVFMQPNYFQVHGLARNFGCRVRPWWLLEDDGWGPDLDSLQTLVSAHTRAIIVTNPNNPTARSFDEEFIDAVVDIARRHGAWILADEVYRGAELSGTQTPSFSGRYERVIVTGGLSKAYGLPGLRIGWAVTTPEMAGKLWARKDYTTIAPGALSEHLARHCLEPATRRLLLDRTRTILQTNWPILEAWIAARADHFRSRAPEAGAIAFVRYDLPVDSFTLSERLRTETGCLLVPGVHFETPRYLRVGFGPPLPRLREGLDRLARIVDPVAAG